MKSRAFTLIELLVVISIIGLLSSVVLVSLNTAREKGRLGAATYFASQIYHIAGDQAVGIWNFDECSGSVANDSSGFGNNGTSPSFPTWSTDTPSGKGCSLSFAGTQYINVGNGTSFNITGALTISAWFKSTNISNQIIIGKNHLSSYYVNMTGNAITFFTNGGSVSGYPNISDNKWHNVVAVYDNGTKTIYVDGISVVTGAGSLTTDTNNLMIGRSDTVANYFQGLIDEVRVYAQSLTVFEVGKLYAEESSVIKPLALAE